MSIRTRWRPRALQLALSALLALAFGCMEANPLPSPGSDTGIPTGGGDDRGGTGGVDDGNGPPPPYADDYAYLRGELTYVSSLTADPGDASVVVVGAPGAASHAGPIQVTAPALELDATLTQDDLGGFATQILGAFDGLEIHLTLLPDPDDPDAEEADGEPAPLAELTLTVRRLGGDVPSFYYEGEDMDGQAEPAPAGNEDPAWGDDQASAGGGARSGFVFVTVAGEDGMVHVRSDVLGITPYARALVLNTADGLSYVGNASGDGALDIALPAESGDVLLVFAASPADPTATTEAITLTVQ